MHWQYPGNTRSQFASANAHSPEEQKNIILLQQFSPNTQYFIFIIISLFEHSIVWASSSVCLFVCLNKVHTLMITSLGEFASTLCLSVCVSQSLSERLHFCTSLACITTSITYTAALIWLSNSRNEKEWETKLRDLLFGSSFWTLNWTPVIFSSFH